MKHVGTMSGNIQHCACKMVMNIKIPTRVVEAEAEAFASFASHAESSVAALLQHSAVLESRATCAPTQVSVIHLWLEHSMPLAKCRPSCAQSAGRAAVDLLLDKIMQGHLRGMH